MACRLATHIRGADVFDPDDIPRLKHVAASLGIRSAMLPLVLEFLEETEFVKVFKGTGGKIVRVRESVPEYRDLWSAPLK